MSFKFDVEWFFVKDYLKLFGVFGCVLMCYLIDCLYEYMIFFCFGDFDVCVSVSDWLVKFVC